MCYNLRKLFQKRGEIMSIPCRKLISMITQEPDSIHFVWNCDSHSIFPISRKCIPNNVRDPLMYLEDNAWISPSSLFSFKVFKSRVLKNTDGQDSSDYLDLNLKMRLPGDADFALCNFSISFLRNETRHVTDMYFRIRKYGSNEIFVKSVTDTFAGSKGHHYVRKRVDELVGHCGSPVAFIQFDIEHFQLINDKYGTQVGDEILTFFNDVLSLICDKNQMFCRLTADIFMIVTPYKNRDEIIEFIHFIETKLGNYKNIDYRLAFGVAVTDDHSMDGRLMQDNAAFARQSVKGNALEHIAFYDEDMRNEARYKKTIEDDMYKALSNDEFIMYLQPKYSISSKRIIGAEALARWVHSEKGMISPVDFVPIFEQNGFILKLDQIIWEKACRKIRHWIDCGIQPVPISVNISREYLQHFDVVNQILEYIKKYNIPKEFIELEVTESVNSSDTSKTIEKMKEAGFVTLMDDFGSGYSSLNMLKTTKFDILKIDKGFLSEFMDSPRGRKIISHTIAMSSDIGLDVIAEGVETKEEADFLRSCGCDVAQGFLYSRPVPESDFDVQLRGNNEVS